MSWEIKPDSPTGAFYVDTSCCTLCGVPEEIAPELFRLGDEHCSVIRQPASTEEISKAIEVMWSAEMECFRYRGTDLAVLQRLGEAGLADMADDAGAQAFPRKLKDHVSFELPPEDSAGSDAATLARAFHDYLQGHEGYESKRYTVLPPRTPLSKTVRFSWFGPSFHSVSFSAQASSDTRFATLNTPGNYALLGVARILDEWLREHCGARSMEWRNVSDVKTDAGGDSYLF